MIEEFENELLDVLILGSLLRRKSATNEDGSMSMAQAHKRTKAEIKKTTAGRTRGVR